MKKGELRPLFSRLTPYGATNTRSPLVSMIFPSLKDKMKRFQEDTKLDASRMTTGAHSMSTSLIVKRSELERIVETETKKRGLENFY